MVQFDHGQFRGAAAPLSAAAIARAAQALRCDEAAVRAVIDVESRGGFLRDGRPKILFERHYFHRLTGGVHSAAHPDISARRWGGYGPARGQYDRLARAIALDRDAALRSASWGAFQIMGDNHAAAGFDDVEAFVAAMMAGEDAHLAAFVAFVRANGLDDALRRHDWAGFARRYNGPLYRRNRYDTKLAAAHRKHANRKHSNVTMSAGGKFCAWATGGGRCADCRACSALRRTVFSAPPPTRR